MDDAQLKKFVNDILKKNGYLPAANFGKEFADGILFQLIFNLLFNEQIDCKLKISALCSGQRAMTEDRLINWNKINQVICFNYLQQKFYLFESNMKLLAKGNSDECIYNLLRDLINTQQGMFAEAMKNSDMLEDIADTVETKNSIFDKGLTDYTGPRSAKFDFLMQDFMQGLNQTSNRPAHITKEKMGGSSYLENLE